MPLLHAPGLDHPDALLRAIAARFPNGSVNVFDRDLRYVFTEGEGLQAAHLSTEALLGRRLSDLFAPASVEHVEPFYRRAFAGESVHFDLPLGERIYYISAGPLATEGDVVTLIVAVAQDVTETKRREAELLAREREARERAEYANRAKDDFLSVVSHELRTPINAILGWSDLLTSSPTPAVMPKALGAIRRSATRQRRLIDDLLDLSRMGSGSLRLTFEAVHASALLTSVVELVLPQAAAKGIRVDARFDEVDIGVINGDRDRLEQALSNIVVNAVKFTPRDGRISVEAHGVEDGIEVRVTDTGIGIVADFLPRVFDRFAQMDRAGHRRSGLGLGLALAKEIVTAHGGTIEAHSDGAGCGTTMTVYLPRQSSRPVG
jgi:signal transduction histidine kinase